MPKVLANGVTLSYQQTGNGSDLVMIHGLAASRAFWYPLIAQQLEQKFRVTFYDLRGHGYSEMPAAGYTSQDMALDLHELLNHLQIHRALLVGHSFGGVIALQYALQHPERVSSLVVADSRISCLQPVQRLKDTDYLSELEAAILAASPDIDWENETQIGLRFLEEIAKERWQSLRRESRYGYIPFGGSGGGTRAVPKMVELTQHHHSPPRPSKYGGVKHREDSPPQRPPCGSLWSAIALSAHLPSPDPNLTHLSNPPDSR
uniref:Alpha/beta fold hydrolase n=1 Tax=Desertifilum tharense IPPAS B-1220 TaxID=1781255 RepID=A0ACD5GS24_9CYAN